MKTTALTFLLISILVVAGCRKDDEEPIGVYNLDLKVDVQDSTGASNIQFTEGSKIFFSIKISNPTNEAIGCYYDDVNCQMPELGFEIYTIENKLIGKIAPTEIDCLSILEPKVIGVNESFEYKRYWTQPMKNKDGEDVSHEPLEIGSYYFKYSMTIIDNYLDGRDLPPVKRSVSDKIHFVVL